MGEERTGLELMSETGEEILARALPRRARDVHKGDCGKVLIIAGGGGMPGAAVFAARAALRTGSGLVYVCAPKASWPVVQILAPEAILLDWEEAAAGLVAEEGEAPRFDAVCFGPGMGTSAAARKKLKALLLSSNLPLVLDADGLNLAAQNPDLGQSLKNYTGPKILTPHTGEALRLLDPVYYPDGIQTEEKRMEAAFDLAWTYRCCAVLKGAGTLTARGILDRSSSSGGKTEIWENTSGNPGMATAGMGDVLSGVILSLLGQGAPPWDSARAGVYLHGLAGDLARKELGERGMLATDVIERLPAVIRGWEGL